MKASKNFLRSKTLWFNAITMIVFFCDNYWKVTGLTVELQGIVVGLGNMVLRLLTNKPLQVGEEKK